ncbi:MAG: hypothetical protein ACYTG1_03820 [Planctomycetota bacterium]|jgi:hypothetical protein
MLPRRRRRRRRVARRLVIIVPLLAVVAFVARGCMSSRAIPNRNPVGAAFPEVTGQSLEESPVRLPADLAGGPAILLVGYDQQTQFDIDRWLMGLLQAEADARIVEIPTIPGLVPTMISGWIDDGMRAGIPREDWASVVTLYGKSARPVAELTGTEFAQRTRVLVLDGAGTVVWFDDEGYGAAKALEVARIVGDLGAE